MKRRDFLLGFGSLLGVTIAEPAAARGRFRGGGGRRVRSFYGRSVSRRISRRNSGYAAASRQSGYQSSYRPTSYQRSEVPIAQSTASQPAAKPASATRRNPGYISQSDANSFAGKGLTPSQLEGKYGPASRREPGYMTWDVEGTSLDGVTAPQRLVVNLGDGKATNHYKFGGAK